MPRKSKLQPQPKISEEKEVVEIWTKDGVTHTNSGPPCVRCGGPSYYEHPNVCSDCMLGE